MGDNSAEKAFHRQEQQRADGDHRNEVGNYFYLIENSQQHGRIFPSKELMTDSVSSSSKNNS